MNRHGSAWNTSVLSGSLAVAIGLALSSGAYAAPLPHLNLAQHVQRTADALRSGSGAAARAPGVQTPRLAGNADLFFENFNSVCAAGTPATPYLPPASWIVHNVDGRTPAATSAWVTDAWVVRERLATVPPNNNDCAMWSTSSYSPVGAANDWAVLPANITPTAATKLSWHALALDPDFRDGYEVRYSTAGTAPADFLANPPLLTVAAENSIWTPREASLGALAGTPVRLAFRNATNDRYVLGIDDVRVFNLLQFDPVLTALRDVSSYDGYAKLPAGLGFGVALESEVQNAGFGALTALSVELDLAIDGTDVGTLTAPVIVSLGPGASQTVVTVFESYQQLSETFQIAQEGEWTVRATVTASEGDEALLNSTASASLVTITANELSRAQGESTDFIGIGNGDGGELGQDFELPEGGRLTAVRYRLNNSDLLPDNGMGNLGDGVADFNGRTLEVAVRGWNAIADEPGQLLATASVTVPTDAPIGSVELEFALAMPLDLGPGRYLIAAMEPTPPEAITLRLETTPERFTEGTVWVNWPSTPFGGWINPETIDPELARSFQMSAILEPLRAAIFADGFEN